LHVFNVYDVLTVDASDCVNYAKRW